MIWNKLNYFIRLVNKLDFNNYNCLCLYKCKIKILSYANISKVSRKARLEGNLIKNILIWKLTVIKVNLNWIFTLEHNSFQPEAHLNLYGLKAFRIKIFNKLFQAKKNYSSSLQKSLCKYVTSWNNFFRNFNQRQRQSSKFAHNELSRRRKVPQNAFVKLKASKRI